VCSSDLASSITSYNCAGDQNQKKTWWWSWWFAGIHSSREEIESSRFFAFCQASTQKEQTNVYDGRNGSQT
jgi:hypothetical protein